MMDVEMHPITWVFVGGAIGAGKSTLCHMLQTRLETEQDVAVVFLAEYVETKQGLEMLQKFLTNTISQFDFQEYILDFYATNLASIPTRMMQFPPRRPVVILVERHPMDSIVIFSKRSVQQKKITQDQYTQLYEKAHSMQGIPQFMPTAQHCKVWLLNQKPDYAGINDDVYHWILTAMTARNRRGGEKEKVLYVILLFDTSRTAQQLQRENLSIRDRQGESSYTDEYLNWINDAYKSVYPYPSI